MENLGLGLLASTWLYFTVLSFVGASGCCYLLRTLIPAARSTGVPGLLAGLVFLYNPLYMVDTYKSLFIGLPERASLPLALALYANGLEKRSLRYFLPFACL